MELETLIKTVGVIGIVGLQYSFGHALVYSFVKSIEYLKKIEYL